MSRDNLDTYLEEIAEMDAATTLERVRTWRQILTRIWNAGYDHGYRDAHLDHAFAARIDNTP